EWIDQWHGLLERYKLTPVCYLNWLDTRMHAGRDLDLETAVKIFDRDLELAHRLGFKLMKPKFGVVSRDLTPHPMWRQIVERCLQTASDYDVRIAPEIHAPTRLNSEVVDAYLSLIADTGTKHFGLLIDTGIFQRGTRPSDHSDSIYRFGPSDPESVKRSAAEMRAPLAEAPSDLAAIIDHVVYIHAKFWEMTDSFVDPQIPYDEIVETLVKSGYRGWICSEYEGNREPGVGSEQVRRQQLMLRRLLAGA
ncbi:MAG TPA: TIM barrel protein, partial [Actinospica sp.]|nr:TIM barrel protein [Actinospica sp.]